MGAHYTPRMRIVTVPCLADNFCYLVIDEATRRAVVVDPGEAGPVLAALAREGVTLGAVWATHHHPDHVGGTRELLRGAGGEGIDVVAHASDRTAARVPGQTRAVEDGEQVVMDGITAQVIYNPGHTLGAISYWVRDADQGAGAVFTGDTLFGGGCGRVFEGTAPMMHASLHKVGALPGATRVYFGHEYTAANLRFAAAVEPTSAPIAARVAALTAARARGEHSTPSTLADEHATNPFLRTADAAVRAAAATRDPAAASDAVVAFAALRQWKNDFK